MGSLKRFGVVGFFLSQGKQHSFQHALKWLAPVSTGKDSFAGVCLHMVISYLDLLVTVSLKVVLQRLNIHRYLLESLWLEPRDACSDSLVMETTSCLPINLTLDFTPSWVAQH